ncbi:MAG: DNA polymerase IV [Terriglobia bacterium]
MNSVIFHVDMDAFFVSVEELYDPTLRGRAVIVGGNPNHRGVVAAASYESRRYGVHSAMPLRTAVRLCPHAVFLPPRRERYAAASRQIREIFSEFSPQVEMVSVDEAYLNLTGTERLWGPPLRAAHRLHEEIARRARLPCSIGVSGSRRVSKIASDQAKPNGILWIMPGREAAFLAPLPVGKIPGVGKVTQTTLHEMGIHTIGDLARSGPDLLQSRLGQYGLALFAIARGGAEEALSPGDADWDGGDGAKSVGHEETFAEDVGDPAELESVLADLSQRVAARLREHGLHARTITLKLRYANFQTLTRADTLPESTQLDGVILDAARSLLRLHWDRRRKVRLLGVQSSGLTSVAGQENLLEASQHQKWGRALAATDRLRDRYGFASVQLASALMEPGEKTERTEESERKSAGAQRKRVGKRSS